ncbi:MAG: GNAT family N-acetyltransferase [Gammaproteobacteria bacterium]|nr:GNAT family N-acetyltransferase [Gammaproteobacteria bacterium]
MKLRSAQLDDLPILLKFEQGVIEEERPCNDAIKETGAHYYDLRHLLSDPNTSLQVVEHDGRIIGCGYTQLRVSQAAFVHDKHAYLGFMYVLPDFRGQGVNRLIVESLLEWSREMGVSDFYLDVYVDNQPAVRAYEKAGFEPSLVEMKLKLDA